MHIEEMENISPLDAFASIRRMGSPFMLTWENRYSYVGASPLLTVRTENGRTTLEEKGRAPMEWPEPFSAISAVLKERGETGKAPFPFATGFAGYYGYGLKDAIEPPAQAKTNRARKTLALPVPDCVAGLYDPVFVHDCVEKKGWLASRTGDKARLKAFRRALSEKAPEQKAPPAPLFRGFASNITKEEYLAAIARAKDYISAGDIYQINISQRLETPWDGDPFTLYAGLLKARPAPFSSFFDYGSFQVVSNSPERLLKVTDGTAETCPIKGTRPRGKTPEEDRAHIEELGSNMKERAEHVMIVDLERNDLGRISIAGSVEVSAFEAIETYPALHHMVSTIRGRLRPGMDAPAALKAVFPGGSITGAPKIRAMEIIDELEASPRGVYTGGIGWIDMAGDMDISMAIRTAVCVNGSVFLNVGGGIVADSMAEDEYEETLLKAKDFLDVMGVVTGGRRK